MREVQRIGQSEWPALLDEDQHPFVRSEGPSFRPDLPSGRVPRAAAVKDAAAKAAPAEPARSVLDRASTVLTLSGRDQAADRSACQLYYSDPRPDRHPV